MVKITDRFEYYIVTTSEWKWGRGQTLKQALEAARALNPKGKLRRGVKVEAQKNIQTDEDILTEESINAFSDCHYIITGYKPGDYLLPFVNDYGTTVYCGKIENIEGFDFI